MTDAVLMDYNGVIAADEPLHFAAFRDVLAEHGLELDESTYYAEYLGLDDRSAFVEVWRRAHRTVTGELLRILVDDKAAMYARRVEGGVPQVPGAAQFVLAAAARWPVAVVSGALKHEITAGLAQAGIADAVQTVISAEDVPVTKPDPAGYRLALSRVARAAPTRAVVIEDSLPGLQAARSLGAGCLMLTTSLSAGKIAGADLVWRDFIGHEPAELAPLFRAIHTPR